MSGTTAPGGITETVSAELTITRPSAIALQEKTFALLADQAAYNDAARALIGRALERRSGQDESASSREG